MYILADTGILLRLHEPTDSRHAVVERAVRSLRTRGDDLVVAFQNLTEFWSTSTRPKIARGGFGLSHAETERRLGLIEVGFSLLDEPPPAYPNWRNLVIAHQVSGRQVHDARLVGLMQVHRITHILTLNGADFARYPGIVVLDPAAVARPSAPSPPTP